MVKFNGETHADITPGEFTQLTGRAGRRGIDVEGHAVVLWQPGLDPRAVAGLASRRTYPLRSSFAPTYNMAVNLVGRVGRERARTLLEQSFAQFQSDRSVVGTARSLARNTEAIADNWQAACLRPRGLRGIRPTARRDRRTGVPGGAGAAQRPAGRSAATAAGSAAGDIVRIPAGKHTGWAVVVDPDTRSGDRDNPRPLVLTEDRQVKRLSLTDFPTPPQVASRMRIPKHFHPKDTAARRSLGAALRSRLAELDPGDPRLRPAPANEELTAEIQRRRDDLARHPCHSCPDRERHARRAEKALLLERENERAQQRMSSRTNTIATQFDKICLVLGSLGYLADDEHGETVVTDAGRMLRRIYAELDLVAAECMRDGVFDDLTAPQLAAVLAALIFEARRSDDGYRKPRMPDSRTEAAMVQVRRRHREVSLVERDARLPRGPELDIGFSAPAFGWADGQPLAVVLADSGLTAGDFVRWVRQVIDFAGQIGDAAGPGPLREVARDAVFGCVGVWSPTHPTRTLSGFCEQPIRPAGVRPRRGPAGPLSRRRSAGRRPARVIPRAGPAPPRRSLPAGCHRSEHARGPEPGEGLGVDELIGALRQDHLRQAGFQGTQHRPGAAVWTNTSTNGSTWAWARNLSTVTSPSIPSSTVGSPSAPPPPADPHRGRRSPPRPAEALRPRRTTPCPASGRPAAGHSAGPTPSVGPTTPH